MNIRKYECLSVQMRKGVRDVGSWDDKCSFSFVLFLNTIASGGKSKFCGNRKTRMAYFL
ncbi:hypothetical protein [uncultured Odoribacter sp.]|uniref:hypothetical protein n=1 Tax=uncultured Odoribacter sp. TaxID=876416 RepID=UPI0026075505|nr:hypothetical protein [uncultured Odoribacter sp.]